MAERLLQCNRDKEGHGGALRKDGDGYICWNHWAEELGIPVKTSPGRPVHCSECGEELMTRDKHGGLSFKTVSMHGEKAKLSCDCGHDTFIANPFAQKVERNLAAREPLRRADARRDRTNKAIGSAGIEKEAEDSEATSAYPAFFHDNGEWVPLNALTKDRYFEILEEVNGTAS